MDRLDAAVLRVEVRVDGAPSERLGFVGAAEKPPDE
jgi:hypothetical protein